MRSRRSVISTALLLAAAVATAGFTTAPAPAPHERPEAHHTSRWGPGTTVAAAAVSPSGLDRDRSLPSARAALDAVENRRDLSGPGVAARHQLAALTGTGSPHGDDEAQVVTASSAPEEVEAAPSWSFGEAVADLDGDGLDDVVIASYDDEAEAITLTARRGTDGTELWSLVDADVSDLFAWVVPDVTGDGGPDLLVWDLSYDEYGCEDEDCDGWYEEFTWMVRVRDGRTGQATWSQTFPGNYRETLTFEEGESLWGDTYDYAVETEATNYWVIPVVADDHDGDGVRDIVLNRVDFADSSWRSYSTYEDPLPIRASGESRDLTLRSTASLLGGATGTEFWQRSVEGADGDAFLWPFGDASGSPTEDLLWRQYGYPTGSASCRHLDVLVVNEELECTEDPAGAWTVAAELLDGDTRESAWSLETVDGDNELTTFWGAYADLNADGRTDLFEIADSWNEDTFETATTITARSGADGEALWSAETSWGAAVAVGSLDGGDNDDVLIVDYVESYEDGYTVTLDLRRVDGATGAELLRTARTFTDFGNTWTDIWAWLTPDVDGDGIEDLGVGIWVYDFETDEEHNTEVLESTTTGDELFRIEGDGGTVVHDVADLDGDGDGEILVGELHTIIVEEDDWFYEELVGIGIEARQHDSGEVLWTLPRLDYWEDWLDVGGDLDGIPGDDLVESRVATAPTGVTVRNGATGAVVWTR